MQYKIAGGGGGNALIYSRTTITIMFTHTAHTTLLHFLKISLNMGTGELRNNVT